MGKGKLIVLEGIDGSGKSAQYRRLCQRMENDKIAYNHIVFPRYNKESSALIRLYLGGAFGTHPGDVNAYTASAFYAVDRFASYRDDWGRIYEDGGLILSDRYTTSNAVHQGSKLPDAELPAFFSWLADLEYRVSQAESAIYNEQIKLGHYAQKLSALDEEIAKIDRDIEYYQLANKVDAENRARAARAKVEDKIFSFEEKVRACEMRMDKAQHTKAMAQREMEVA